MNMTLRTSNPAFSGDVVTGSGLRASYGSTMTISGAVNKAGLLMICVVLTAMWTWNQFLNSGGDMGAVSGYMMLGGIGGFIAALVTIFKKEWSPVSAPVYALLEGLFLGGISATMELRFPGIAIQAVALTFGTCFCMLLAYRSGLIRPTQKFMIGVVAATGGIALVYFASMILGLFHVQIPGIDNLSQLLPLTVHIPDGTWDVNDNFPKLASSAAHLFGRPRVWTEDGGDLGLDGKFQLDFQLIRGLNTLQLRIPVRAGTGAGPAPPTAPAQAAPAVPPQAPMLAWYTNRAGYLMAIGRPAAQVGLYHPSNSMWLGDEEADRSTTKIGWQLLEHQVDWDYFDEQSLSSVATIADGGFKNLSGQVYRAIVVPSSTVITKTGLERFQAFVKAGGKLIFVGKTPTMLVDKTFRDAKGAPDLGFATLIEPSGNITPQVLAALPKPDVKVDADFPRLTYMHRIWRDGDMYFFFNESNKEESRTVTVAGKGQTQVWDCGAGQVRGMSGATAEGDSVRFPLILKPYEAKLITISPNAAAGFGAEPAQVTGTPLMELDGDWTLDLNGQHLTTPLKSWQDLGAASFVGPAIYHKQFTLSALPAGKRVILEVGDGSEFIRPTVNGAVFDGLGGQAYRWDITTALQPGANDLQFTVYGTPAARGGSAGTASAGAAPAAGGGQGVGPAGSATALNAPGARAELRVRGIFTPPSSGVLGPVRLVVR